MTSTKYKYTFIGQPPNQPRTSTFVPRSERTRGIGKAEVISESALESPVANNSAILEDFDLGDDKRSLKAGDVIIAAEPFIIVPATRLEAFHFL